MISLISFKIVSVEDWLKFEMIDGFPLFETRMGLGKGLKFSKN